ncbi:ABC1 kinase family protein [Siminovitchia sediminis]|uniref:ABC1 kinase family protein n=1 Tax=Siminovitchia sediminis TaxID=1274353 RepID=A0ABW4KBG4_9BACI
MNKEKELISVKTNSKFFRMYKVLSMFFIFFLQIYWYKLRRKQEDEWEKLWGSIGKRFRRTLFELEGLLIKVGQMISSRADLLPRPLICEIEDLTDQVPPSDWSEIQEILEKEWGSSHKNFLLSVEKEAIASASIGEVYRGILKDGSKVAIKVQRPHIYSVVQTDFRTLRMVIWFANYFIPIPKGFINLKVLFSELKQVIERELDFTMEKETLLNFQERFKGCDIVQIPQVYDDLCTSKILVMEWVDGIKITDITAVNQLNITRKELAQRLIKVFLPQWLEPGKFHADPHPGNILVSGEGRIILLDFGMAGEISVMDASAFQSFIESLVAKNYGKAVDCMSSLGFLLPEADTKIIERLLAEWSAFQPSQMTDIDLIAFKRELNDLIQKLPIQVPTRFVFLGRSFIAIEGIVTYLMPGEEIIELGKPVFMEWLVSQGNKWSFDWQWIQSQPLFKAFYSVTEFLKTPEKLEHLKETEQRRQFQFTIYENQKKQLFQMTLFGLSGIAAGIYLGKPFILNLFIIVSSFSITGYVITSYKLNRWMKYMYQKR